MGCSRSCCFPNCFDFICVSVALASEVRQQDTNRDGNWDGKKKAQEDNSLRSASAPTSTQGRDQLIYSTCGILEYVNRKMSSRLREEIFPLWYVN